MNNTETEVKICAKCGKEIQVDAPHFWGRHGGEWHPLCFREFEEAGGITAGMWQNCDSEGPIEYRDAELKGFMAQLGIDEAMAQIQINDGETILTINAGITPNVWTFTGKPNGYAVAKLARAAIGLAETAKAGFEKSVDAAWEAIRE